MNKDVKRLINELELNNILLRNRNAKYATEKEYCDAIHEEFNALEEPSQWIPYKRGDKLEDGEYLVTIKTSWPALYVAFGSVNFGVWCVDEEEVIAYTPIPAQYTPTTTREKGERTNEHGTRG